MAEGINGLLLELGGALWRVDHTDLSKLPVNHK